MMKKEKNYFILNGYCKMLCLVCAVVLSGCFAPEKKAIEYTPADKKAETATTPSKPTSPPSATDELDAFDKDNKINALATPDAQKTTPSKLAASKKPNPSRSSIHVGLAASFLVLGGLYKSLYTKPASDKSSHAEDLNLGMANFIKNPTTKADNICHFNSLVKFLSRHPHVSSESTSKASIDRFYQAPYENISGFAKSFHDLIVLNTQNQSNFLKGSNEREGSKNLEKEILSFSGEILTYFKSHPLLGGQEEFSRFGTRQMSPDDVLSKINELVNMIPLTSLVIADGEDMMPSKSPTPGFFLFSLGHDFKYSPDYGDTLDPASSIQDIMEKHKGHIQYRNKAVVSDEQRNYFMLFIERNGSPERTPCTIDLNLTVQVEKEEKSFLLQSAILHFGTQESGHYTALTVHHDDSNQSFFLYHDDRSVTKKPIDDLAMIEKLKTDSTMLLYVEKK